MSISHVLPLGTIVAFGLNETNIPENWLLCDGSEIPDKFQELITILGSKHTPNLAGRTLVGSGKPDDGKQNDGNKPGFPKGAEWAINDTGGEYQTTLSVEELPPHDHDLVYKFDLDSGCHSHSGSTPCKTNTTQKTEKTGGGKPHFNMQPYRTVHYIIFTGVI